ncbi:hypothetical protein K0M31_001954 [Melipona bicolor]|uniref:USP domain-containing protein n=1 Tax=Melipona bicolor TaxID=60889 RepID=A0AA40GGT9_9HYME|nr:hypothetical protein K0M31_001954 [Melipona bicolor]
MAVAMNTASDLTSSSPTAPSTAHQNLHGGIADQFEGSLTNKSVRNRLQAHRDQRCGLNGLRTIGNTCFINSAIRCLEHFTREEVLYNDNEHHHNRDNNNDNVSCRHSNSRSVSRRNCAFAGKQPVVGISSAAGAAPAVKLDRVNRRRAPRADRAAYVQRQLQFVGLVAGGIVREYEGAVRNTPGVQRAPRPVEGYIHPAGPAAGVVFSRESFGQRLRQ